jgi:hypothetical protein
VTSAVIALPPIARVTRSARRTRDERDLAVQRRGPVHLARGGNAFADLDHLPRHVGRARREQEAQCRVQLTFGPGCDIDELGGRAAARFLAERAHEPFEGLLSDRRLRVTGGRRRGSEHDDPPAWAHPARGRAEELIGREQVLGGSQAGRVEHERLEAQLLGRGIGVEDRGGKPGLRDDLAQRLVHRGLHLGPDIPERLGDGRGETWRLADLRRAEQHRAGDDRLSGAVALENRRRGQPRLLGEELADRRVDELLVAVRHLCPPGSR